MSTPIKASATITAFAQPLTNQLPSDHTRIELEKAMELAITVWNAVTIDQWHQNHEFEAELLQRISGEKEATLNIKRLIKRKKTKFHQHDWAVGNHWLRDDDEGGIIFGCEARAKSEH